MSLAPWKRLQAVSGLLAGFFLLLHVLNVVAAVVDPSAFDGLLDAFRVIYRPSEFVEALVVWTPLTLHLVASVVVAGARLRSGDRPTRLRSLLRWSGWILLGLGGLHVFVARFMASTLPHGGAVAFWSYGIESWPGWAVPYYLALVGTAALHLGVGGAIALFELGWYQSHDARMVATGTTWALLIGVLLLAGLSRLVFEAPNADPSFYPSYQRTFDRFLPLLHAHNPRAR